MRGRAIGGGAELTTATDLRVFSPDASLSFVQSKMGLSTGWGGGSRLTSIVGRAKALRIMLEKGAIFVVFLSKEQEHIVKKQERIGKSLFHLDLTQFSSIEILFFHSEFLKRGCAKKY